MEFFTLENKHIHNFNVINGNSINTATLLAFHASGKNGFYGHRTNK